MGLTGQHQEFSRLRLPFEGDLFEPSFTCRGSSVEVQVEHILLTALTSDSACPLDAGFFISSKNIYASADHTDCTMEAGEQRDPAKQFARVAVTDASDDHVRASTGRRIKNISGDASGGTRSLPRPNQNICS